MKKSKRNIRNEMLKKEKRADGKPAFSKYGNKVREEVIRVNPPKQGGVVDTSN